MKFCLALLAFVCLAVAGCGGSDEVLTGTFAGSVSQLHYKTKTQSGMTDAGGAFKYQKGEKVTFSVGGTTLGESAGAGTVTMFDLFGVVPPTDAVIIEQHLGLSTLVSTASGDQGQFVRAINAWTFLLALDVDGKSNNGIDLTGRDAQLKSVHVGFNFTTNAFVDEQLNIAAQIPNYAYRPFGIDSAIAYAYRSAGVSISGDALATFNIGPGTLAITYDANAQVSALTIAGAGAAAGTVNFEHDDDMRLLKQSFPIASSDAGGDPTNVLLQYAFSPTGVYAGSTYSSQKGADPAVVQATATLTYDSAGRLTTYVRGGSDYDRTTYAYDAAAGTVTTLEENRDSEASAATYRSRTQLTYDAKGNVSARMIQSDSTADGTYDGTDSYAITYDDNHNVSKSVDTYTDAAGAVKTYTTVYTYGADNRSLTETYTNPASTYTTTHTYDGDNLIETRYVRADNGASPILQSNLLLTYDDHGRVLTSDDKQFDDFGALNYELQTTFTYDANGNVATTSTTSLGSAPATASFTYEPTSNAVVAALQLQVLFSGIAL